MAENRSPTTEQLFGCVTFPDLMPAGDVDRLQTHRVDDDPLNTPRDVPSHGRSWPAEEQLSAPGPTSPAGAQYPSQAGCVGRMSRPPTERAAGISARKRGRLRTRGRHAAAASSDRRPFPAYAMARSPTQHTKQHVGHLEISGLAVPTTFGSLALADQSCSVACSPTPPRKTLASTRSQRCPAPSVRRQCSADMRLSACKSPTERPHCRGAAPGRARSGVFPAHSRSPFPRAVLVAMNRV